MSKLRTHCKAKDKGCPGMVAYNEDEAVAAAMNSVLAAQDDDDKVYLECDGPETHWFAYRRTDFEKGQ
jgi:hypothetical protein